MVFAESRTKTAKTMQMALFISISFCVEAFLFLPPQLRKFLSLSFYYYNRHWKQSRGYKENRIIRAIASFSKGYLR
jgi:hypothetical protein